MGRHIEYPEKAADINVVTLRQARLVPGWVTVFRQVNHVGAEHNRHPGLLSLSHPSMGKHSEYPAKAGRGNRHIA